MAVWPADSSVTGLLEQVRNQAHLPRLADVKVDVTLTDGPPFVKDRINLGKVTKVPECYRMRQKEPADFEITISGGVWGEMFVADKQRRALLDLHLTRIQPVFTPEIVVENKKRVIVKDEFGRVQYSQDVKLDKNGEPIWRIDPIDIKTIMQNIRRYGFWFDDLQECRSVVLEIDPQISEVNNA